jgi:hypothetical protein
LDFCWEHFSRSAGNPFYFVNDSEKNDFLFLLLLHIFNFDYFSKDHQAKEKEEQLINFVEDKLSVEEEKEKNAFLRLRFACLPEVLLLWRERNNFEINKILEYRSQFHQHFMSAIAPISLRQ